MGATQTIAMPATIRIGLAVTSHTTGTLATATFDNVVLDAPPSAHPARRPTLNCTSGVGQCQLSWSAVTGASQLHRQAGDHHAVGPYARSGSPASPATSFTDTMVTVPGRRTSTWSRRLNGAPVRAPTAARTTARPRCRPRHWPPAEPAWPPRATTAWGSPGRPPPAPPATPSSADHHPAAPTRRSRPDPTGTSFTDSTAANGTAYFYVVTASNAGGESGDSNEAPATPSLPAPTGVVATAGNAQVSPHLERGHQRDRLPGEALAGHGRTLHAAVTGADLAQLHRHDGQQRHHLLLRGARPRAPSTRGPTPPRCRPRPRSSMAPAPPSNLGATITGGNTGQPHLERQLQQRDRLPDRAQGRRGQPTPPWPPRRSA